MADIKKFLDQTGTGYLWSKIKTELDKKATTADLKTTTDVPIASVANNVVTLKAGIAETNGIIGSGSGSDITLATVAMTGTAADVAIADAGNLITATSVEGALQELATSMATAGAVTVQKETGGANDDFVTKYTFLQNGTTITNGTITIGKDMVATSGELVYPTAQDPIEIGGQTITSGTYIKMTIGNGDDFYINVADLIEYNTFTDGDEIDFTDNNHNITAAIKTGSIAKGKLDSTVQLSLEKADSAVQSVTTGTENGTIKVDGATVAVYGLGSAAYTATTAFATAAQGALADSAVQSVTTGDSNGTIKVDGTTVPVYGLGSAAYTSADGYATAAQGALADTAVQPADIVALTKAEIDSAIANYTTNLYVTGS